MAKPARPIELLIVEDVDVMRQLIAHVFDGVPGCHVSGLAANTWEARLEISRRRPDLVLLDEILPGESSLDLLRELVATGIPVLLLTGVENPTHAIPPGALGRLPKPSWDNLSKDRERLIKAISRLT
jgi:two-component system response regulator CitB